MIKFTSGEWKYLQSPLVGLGGSEQWYLVGSSERAVGFIRHEEDAKLIAAAPEMYELLKVWTQVGAEPMLRNARKRAEELLARIDNEEAEHE